MRCDGGEDEKEGRVEDKRRLLDSKGRGGGEGLLGAPWRGMGEGGGVQRGEEEGSRAP